MRRLLAGLAWTACAAPPVLVSVAPAEAPARGGVSVEIRGESLDDGLELYFGDRPAEAVEQSDGPDVWTAVVPPHLAGSVDVRLVDSDGVEAAILPAGFTYQPLPLDYLPAAAGYLPDADHDLRRAVLGDLDENGLQDVMVVRTNGDLRQWFSQGNGAFEEDSAGLPLGRVRDLELVDVNGDGHLDAIACFSTDDALRVLIGDGTGGWVDSRQVPIDTGSCLDVAVDQDGTIALLREHDGAAVLDWLTATESGWQRRLPAQSDATAGPCPAVDASCVVVPRDGGGFAAQLEGAGSLVFPLSPDGRELESVAIEVVEVEGGAITAWFDDAAGERFSRELHGVEGPQVVRVDAGWSSLEGDGEIDLPLLRVGFDINATAGPMIVDEVSLRFDDGGRLGLARFEQWPSLVPLDGAWHFVEVRDADGDDDLDVVLAGAGAGGTAALFLDSAGALRPAEDSRLVAPICGLGSVLWRDLNADGSLDLFLPCRDGQDRFLVGDGHARFFDDTVSALPVDNAFSVRAESADLNLDGLPELLVGTWGGVDRLYRGGAERFVDDSPALGLQLTHNRQVLPVDADGDGDQDLITIGRDGARLFVLE